MARKHRNVLWLRTKEEQDYALKLAKGVHQEVKEKILSHDDRDALLFARGYLLAIKDLAKAEGVPGLSDEVERLLHDLERAYHEVPPESRNA